MGVKDRREREKQATRQGILTGARHIARAEGWPALTIRKVAEYIEYSPSIVYEYFASKDAILLELLEDGFAILTALMRQAVASTGDPQRRLERIGEAYWQFASEHPDLYQVMHGLDGVAIDPAARNQAALTVCGLVEDAIDAWSQANGIALEDLRGSAEIAWSLLHGLVSLNLGERLEEARAKHLMERALAALLLGWRAQAAEA